jgi:hypothetical protein
MAKRFALVSFGILNGMFMSVAISTMSSIWWRGRGLKHILFVVNSAPASFVEFAIMQKLVRAVFAPRQPGRFKESYN